MNAFLRLLVLLASLSLPVLLPVALQQSVPPVSGACGACVCITPGSIVTIPDGGCGTTSPGGDTVTAIGGPVTVTTDAANALTSVVMPAGVQAAVDVASGPAAFVVLGGAAAVVHGHGLTLDVNMPGGTLTLTGTGVTVDDGNGSAAPTRYVSTFAGPASNTLELHGHAGARVEGPWWVNP
jgi:hypothetical protein